MTAKSWKTSIMFESLRLGIGCSSIPRYLNARLVLCGFVYCHLLRAFRWIVGGGLYMLEPNRCRVVSLMFSKLKIVEGRDVHFVSISI